MRIQLLCGFMLLFGSGLLAIADMDEWRLTEAPPPISQADRSLIGRTVCGAGQFEMTEAGVRCKVCPKFTGNAGSDEGLEIGLMSRGRFTAAGAEGEWLLDTDGCEAHYTSFGGAILLSPAAPKTLGLGMPALSLGSSLTSKAVEEPLTQVFYKPGFRLNDCLTWGGDDSRSLLVCNEADMAQGEVIGHISSMEISRRGITRWRLLRWYDNAGSDLPQIVSVVPSGMRRIELEDGQPGLQIKVKILETSREDFEKETAPAPESVSLIFQRKGQRFFATKKTQGHLQAISILTRKMLE